MDCLSRRTERNERLARTILHCTVTGVYRESIIVGFAQALQRVRGLLLLPVFAQLLGTDEYGLFTQSLISVALLTPVVGLRLEIPLIRALAGKPTDDGESDGTQLFSGLFAIALAGAVVSALLVMFRSQTSVLVFGEAASADLAAAAAAALIGSAASGFALEYFRAAGKVVIQSIGRLVQSASELLVVAVVLWSGGSVADALLGVAGVGVSTCAVVCLFVLTSQGAGSPSVSRGIRMAQQSLPLVPNGMLRWALSYADRLVIVQLLGIGAVGVYSAGYSLAASVQLIASPLGFVVFPRLIRSWEAGKKDAALATLRATVRVVVAVALPAAIAISVASEPLLEFVADERFVAPTAVVLALALAGVMDALFQVVSYLCHLTNRLGLISLVLTVGVAVNIALNIVLVPQFGLEGAAAATLISEIGMLVLLSAAIPRYGMFPDRRTVGAAVAGCAVISLVGFAPGGDGVALLALLAALVSYAALLHRAGLFESPTKVMPSSDTKW